MCLGMTFRVESGETLNFISKGKSQSLKLYGLLCSILLGRLFSGTYSFSSPEIFDITNKGAEEMAQRLRGLATPSEDLG